MFYKNMEQNFNVAEKILSYNEDMLCKTEEEKKLFSNVKEILDKMFGNDVDEFFQELMKVAVSIQKLNERSFKQRKTQKKPVEKKPFGKKIGGKKPTEKKPEKKTVEKKQTEKKLGKKSPKKGGKIYLLNRVTVSRKQTREFHIELFHYSFPVCSFIFDHSTNGSADIVFTSKKNKEYHFSYGDMMPYLVSGRIFRRNGLDPEKFCKIVL